MLRFSKLVRWPVWKLYLLLSIASCTPTVKWQPQLEGLLKHKLALGQAYLARGEFDLALASFQTASELDSDDARVLDALGCAYFGKGDLETAKIFFRKAIETEKDFSRAYSHLAMVAEANSHFMQAKGLYELALRKNPLNYRARRNYSELLLKLGEISLGIEEGRKAKIAGY